MEKMFSLAYLTVPGTHPADQIEIAARCGYEGVRLETELTYWLMRQILKRRQSWEPAM